MAKENSKEKAAKVAKGDELITALKVLMEDCSKILQNQEEIKESLSKVLPKSEPYVRC